MHAISKYKIIRFFRDIVCLICFNYLPPIIAPLVSKRKRSRTLILRQMQCLIHAAGAVALQVECYVGESV